MPIAPFPVIHAVIAYDKPAAGMRGLSELRRLLRESDESAELDPSLWRIDLVRDPAVRDRILDDIAAADVVVLAVTGSAWGSPAVDLMMELDLDLHRDKRTMFVITDDSGDVWTIRLDPREAPAHDAAMLSWLTHHDEKVA